MRKTISFFFLTGALFLVLGHSLLPHNHIDGQCSQCVSLEEKHSLSDIILHSLSQNLGDKHLEEFNNQQKVYFKALFIIGFEFLFGEANDFHAKKLSLGKNIPLSAISDPLLQYYFQDKGLRAPPVRV